MTAGGRPPERSEGPAAEVGRWVVIGLLGFPLLAWGLAERLGFAIADAFFLAALVELLPVLAIAQVPLVGEARLERVPAYVASGLTVSTLGLAAAFLGTRSFGLEGMGLSRPGPASLLSWTVGLSAAAGALVLLLHALRLRLGVAESPILRDLLPRTAGERGAFALLALAAGIGEELAFRGYAIKALTPHLGGPWQAATFASLTFGLLHAYQGPFGMARTALLGFLFAGSFLLTGSLWAAMVTHVLVDLAAGFLWGDRLTR